MTTAKNTIGAVDRTFEIIEIIQDLNGATVSEIEERVDIGMSGVHNHLTTLANLNYVVKRDNKYDIGLPFLGLGAYARNQTEIYHSARSQVDELANETGELASLMIEQEGMGVYLHQKMGDDAVELDTHLGKRVHLHCTALGKALLGFRPVEDVVNILDERGMPQMTSNTITDQEELLSELEEVRENGYAIDREERISGLRCIAVPITDSDDTAIGSISVSCPIHRISDEEFSETLPDEVLGMANLIEIQHNYS